MKHLADLLRKVSIIWSQVFSRKAQMGLVLSQFSSTLELAELFGPDGQTFK